MAKIKIKFFDTGYDDDFITVEKINSFYNGQVIHIITQCDNTNTKTEILLDKSTAIKFAKTLRTEINKIED